MCELFDYIGAPVFFIGLFSCICLLGLVMAVFQRFLEKMGWKKKGEDHYDGGWIGMSG